MKTPLRNFYVCLLASVYIILTLTACSKRDHPIRPDIIDSTDEHTKLYPVKFQLSGFTENSTAKQVLLWLFKDSVFYDTTTVNADVIGKGSFSDSLPAGNYSVYGVGKDSALLYTDKLQNASPSFNIYFPQKSVGRLDSANLKPNLNFVIAYVTHDSAAQSFYDYFICNNTNFSIGNSDNVANLSFNRLGGQLSIIIDDVAKYPNSMIQFSVGAEAAYYDFDSQKAVPRSLAREQDDHWPGLFNTVNGNATIMQNLTGTTFSVYFYVKKDKKDSFYSLHYIYGVSVTKNKRTILEGNLFDSSDTESSFKTRIVDDWDSHPEESGY